MKKKIKLLVLDVDGTLTDGKIYIGPEGEAVKAFDVKDGYALAVLLPKMGIEPLVITGRKSEIVGKRCLELGICRHGYHVLIAVFPYGIQVHGFNMRLGGSRGYQHGVIPLWPIL